MSIDLIKWRIEKAKITLEEGKSALQNSFNEGAVNRFYYAAFHAVRALLATKSMDSLKHKGVISIFDREFVKRGLISKQSSKTLRRLFEMRAVADYRDFASFSNEEVVESRDAVQALISEINSYLQKELFL